MEINKVRRERLTLPELLKISFAVWVKMFLPSMKILALALLFTAAATVPLVVFGLYITAPAAVYCAVFCSFALGLLYAILALAVLRMVYDVVITRRPSVINAIESVLRTLPRLLLSALILGVLLWLLSMVRPGGGWLFFAVYIVVLYVWLAAIFLYFGFYIMALLFRGSGILATFKFSFLLLKGKWAGAFFRTLLGIILTLVIDIVLLLVFYGVIRLAYGAYLANVYAGVAELGVFALFYYGLKILAPFLLSLVFTWVTGILSWSFICSYMALLFLNTELSEEPNPSRDKVEIIPATLGLPEDRHEFTEFFKKAKVVDIEAAAYENTLTGIAPQTREEALRAFNREEEIPSALMEEIKAISSNERKEDDIIDVLAELKTPHEIKPDDDLPSSILKDK